MKVRVGGRSFSLNPTQQTELVRVQAEVSKVVTDKMVDAVVDMSPRFLRNLQTRMQRAATFEAERLFEVIVAVMDKGGSRRTTGLTYADVSNGMGRAVVPTPGGNIPWKALTRRYDLRKTKQRPQNSNRMFRYNDQLRNYFKGRGKSIVRSRLGGVDINVEPYKAGRGQASPQLETRGTLGINSLEDILLGRIMVTIFPRVSPAMMPMLSSRRWTDTGSGQFEDAIFSGTKARDKLVGRAGFYRPLVAPTAQFFMLVRIPNAIRRSLITYLKKTSLKE